MHTTCRLYLVPVVCQAKTKLLLPVVDAAGQLREVAFALLLHGRRPVVVADLVAATGLRLNAATRAVATLAATGWLDLDESGRVAGAAGLSLIAGPHRLTLGDARFRTWCAYDSPGIAAALGSDALVETACGQCAAPIILGFRSGIPERSGPEQLWLANGGQDLRGSFCTPTVLLYGDTHAAAWGFAQDGPGRRLDLAEAACQGGADWAGCATAARRLA